MISYKAYISDAAYKDIDDIVAYTANELLEPIIANKLMDTLLDAINNSSEIIIYGERNLSMQRHESMNGK